MSKISARDVGGEIDQGTVALMTDELAAGSAMPTVESVFVDRGALAPAIRWSPTPEVLPLDGHRFMLASWTAARGALPFPPVSAIDPFALKPVLGNLIILDVVDGGADFRFRLYGTIIAEAARFDWTGSTVDEMRKVLKGPGPALYLATYRAMLRRREPVYTVNSAMVVFENRAWGRLVLPYGDAAANAIERILVANYVVSDDFVSDDEERRLAQLRETMRTARQRG